MQAETNEVTELAAEQRSKEVKYAHFWIEPHAKRQKRAGVLLKRFSIFLKRFSFEAGDSGRKRVRALLGYRRKRHFDEGNRPGQDFATVRGGACGYIVGVVADGVSQSFYGHLAAYHLATWLLNTLWQERESLPSKDRLEEKLKELEKEVAPEVERYPIADNLVPIHRKVLEDRRPEGSQAVFAAFVWDTQKNWLYLYQVGDVDALVHYPDKSPELVQGVETGRWSSAGKSEMHLKERSYKDISGVVIKSDGAGKDWGESLEDNVFDQSAFNRLAQQRAGHDDISFVAAHGDALEEAPVRTKTRTRVMPERGQRRLRRYKQRRNQRGRKAVLFVAGFAVCVLLVATYLFIKWAAQEGS